MKKIFTLLSLVLVSLCLNAETLIDFSQNPTGGITLSGSTVISNVKINGNTTSIAGIKFANSYLTNNEVNDHYAKLTVEGGFKTGDVITIAGAFNNDDDSKKAAIDIFTISDKAANVLFTSQQFVNGRKSQDQPTVETYTLTADVDELYIGRNGNTASFVTTLTVVRGGSSSIVDPLDPTPATSWNFTADLSSADQTNLAADEATWTYDSGKGYWSNKVALAERSVLVSLKANNTELDIAKGLTFARDNSEGLGADRVRIAPGKYIAVNGSNVTISLGKMAKNDVIKIIVKGAGDSERTLTPTNAVITEGTLTTTDTELHTAKLTVEKDGVVSFVTTNGFQFMALAINTDLPKLSGIKAVKAVASDTPAYDLAGKKVAVEKGILIKNGKKVVKK